MISSSLDITASRPGPSEVASASIMASTRGRSSRSPHCPAGRRTTGDSNDASSSAPNTLNHIGYVAGDYRAESDRLTKLGMPRFLDAKTGEIEEYYHWAPELGVTLEIHKDTEFIRNTHVALRQAARDWDGKDPLRPVPTA